MEIEITNFINLPSDRLLEVLGWRNSAYRVLLKTKEAFGNGVIHFNSLTAASADIGLYKDEQSTLPKTGTFLMRLLLIEAEQKGLKTLKLKTLKENERALGLYKKFSFESVFEDEKILYMQKEI